MARREFFIIFVISLGETIASDVVHINVVVVVVVVLVVPSFFSLLRSFYVHVRVCVCVWVGGCFHVVLRERYSSKGKKDEKISRLDQKYSPSACFNLPKLRINVNFPELSDSQ